MRSLIILFSILFSMQAYADVVTKEVSYNADITLKGFMAYPENVHENTPGVIIVHEWWGHNEHTRYQAKKFADAGFVAFALDMYGEGKNTGHPKEAKEFMMMAYKNQSVANKRFEQALTILKKDPKVHPKKIGAVGYCFGGKVVLDQARQNNQLMGVVSIHGGLAPMEDTSSKKIKTPILVLHGEDDPMIDDQALIGFSKEMTQRKANFEFVSYKGVLHAFTNPGATKIGKEFGLPLAYDEKADKDAHAKAIEFLKNKL